MGSEIDYAGIQNVWYFRSVRITPPIVEKNYKEVTIMKKINEFLMEHPIIEGVLSGIICGSLLLATFYIILTVRGF